jgi:hypothetical protein
VANEYVKSDAANFIRQQHSAADWEREHHKKLLAEGWNYDVGTRTYKHPEKPEMEITRG